VQGRITQTHLPQAEESSPGITRHYETLAEKPRTFLDLLWDYEVRRHHRAACKKARKRRAGWGVFL